MCPTASWHFAKYPIPIGYIPYYDICRTRCWRFAKSTMSLIRRTLYNWLNDFPDIKHRLLEYFEVSYTAKFMLPITSKWSWTVSFCMSVVLSSCRQHDAIFLYWSFDRHFHVARIYLICCFPGRWSTQDLFYGVWRFDILRTMCLHFSVSYFIFSIWIEWCRLGSTNL